MNRLLQQAIDEWDNEVSLEAVKLIETGVPPYDAMDEARRTVSNRRKKESAKTIGELYREKFTG